MWHDTAHLLDILKAIRRIEAFVLGVEYEGFLANAEKHWAVASQLAVIGEAANRLSDSFCEKHPGIPWREIIGMRNRVIHGYDEISWRMVWETIQNDLPSLRKFAEERVSEQERPGSGE